MIRGSVLFISLLLATPASALSSLTNTAITPNANLPVKTFNRNVVSPHSWIASTQQIETLLTVTGITNHLPAIHELIHEARARHIHRCRAEPGSGREPDAYQSQNLQKLLTGALRKNLLPEHLATVLQWYDTDTARRVVNSEKRTRAIASFENVLTLAKQSPNWNLRESLIVKIESHTNANRLGVITAIETEHAGLVLSGCIETYAKQLALAADSDTPENSTGVRTNRERLMAQIIRGEKSVGEKLHYQDTLDGMTFSLQDVSQDDLAKYAEFVASPAAQHVYTALVDVMEQTLQRASAPQAEQSNAQLSPDQDPVSTHLD